MDETSGAGRSTTDAPMGDPDEAAFQRLALGLASLRRDAERLREPGGGIGAPAIDQQAIADALAEVNRRIDGVASRLGAAGDSGPILTALAAVEEKIGTLTAGLDRFAERSALTEALAKADSKIDSLAARIDARLTRLQDHQTELRARLDPPGSAPGSASPAEPERRRSHLPALLLVLMLISAAGALAWLRPDLVRADWIRREWLEPAHDTLTRWLRLSRSAPGPASSQAAALARPDQVAGAAVPAPPAAEDAAVPAAATRDEPNAGAGITDVSAREPTVQAPPATELAATERAATELAVTKLAAPEPLPAIPDTAQAAASRLAIAEPAPPVVQIVPAASRIVPAAPRIVLAAKADVWLLVRGEDGHTLLARILHDGESWPVPNLPGLRLTTGNAGATTVLIDGIPLPSLGGRGGVLRDIPLDAGLLGAAVPPDRTTPNKPHPPGTRPASINHPEIGKPSATASR